MKFSDGNWLHQKGVTPHYAAEAYVVTEEEYGLTILAPCHPIRHRGDTLSGPMLTIRLNAPRPGIISVKISNFEGVSDKGPHFRLDTVPVTMDCSIDERSITFRSGDLSAVIQRNPFSIRFESNGRELTSGLGRSAAWMEVAEKGAYTSAQLSLGVGELVYGLGERFTPFVKNGQTVDIWNEDGGTNSDQA